MKGSAESARPGYDPETQAAALDMLESYYLDDGWYSDGLRPQRDYYVPWAMHVYGLIYARLAGQRDPKRAQRFRERAAAFAPDFAHWFADDGSALPFGRSLTYRFCQGAFWGGLAFADVEALPWNQVKGAALRHLRWWADQPIADNAGVLTIGYRYPNLTMAEQYNSPGSPYWAMKFFLPLALPETHAFWQANEAPLPELDPVHQELHAGLIMTRDQTTGQVTALSSGQQNLRATHGVPKYGKFAYSTAFGFSVPAGERGLDSAAADSMIALSDDDLHWRVREELDDARLDGDVLWSRWRPLPGVEIETWLLPHLPWHVRVHHLRTDRVVFSAEGGFALDRTGDDHANLQGSQHAGIACAYATYPAGASGLRDLNDQRRGENVEVRPNTNLLHPRTVLPTLRDTHQPGEHWLVCAVLASTDADGWARGWATPPTLGDVHQALPDLRLDGVRR